MELDLTTYFNNIFLGWLISSVLLGAVHIGLWVSPWRLTPPVTYIVGVGILHVGYGVWGWQQAEYGPIDPRMAIVAAILISTSGFWIGFGWWVRGGLTLFEKQVRKKADVDRVLEEVDEAHDQG
jgi:hypothetical protein